MREWCSCGAAIRGTKRTVNAWRDSHLHPDREDPREPDKQGTTSQVEHSGSRYFESSPVGAESPIVYARIRFTPNETQG